MSTIQYRVAFGKGDEAVEGPDEAEVVVTVPRADAALDPAVAFMRGSLKTTGPTRPLLDALADGSAAAALARLLASRA